jgi:hypothetical protein
MLRNFYAELSDLAARLHGRSGLVTGGSVFISTNLLLRLASEPAMMLNIDVKPPEYPPETDA